MIDVDRHELDVELSDDEIAARLARLGRARAALPPRRARELRDARLVRLAGGGDPLALRGALTTWRGTRSSTSTTSRTRHRGSGSRRGSRRASAGDRSRARSSPSRARRWRPASACRSATGHRDQEEIYVVLSGSGRIKIDDEILDLRQGDVVAPRPRSLALHRSGIGGTAVSRGRRAGLRRGRFGDRAGLVERLTS